MLRSPVTVRQSAAEAIFCPEIWNVAQHIALGRGFAYIAASSRHWKLCRARRRKPPGLELLRF